MPSRSKRRTSKKRAPSSHSKIESPVVDSELTVPEWSILTPARSASPKLVEAWNNEQPLKFADVFCKGLAKRQKKLSRKIGVSDWYTSLIVTLIPMEAEFDEAITPGEQLEFVSAFGREIDFCTFDSRTNTQFLTQLVSLAHTFLQMQSIDVSDRTTTDDSVLSDAWSISLRVSICGWLLAWALDDLKLSRQIARTVRDQIRQWINHVTDTDGTPHARLINDLKFLIPLFHVSLAIENYGKPAHGISLLNKSTQKQLRKLFEIAVGPFVSQFQSDEQTQDDYLTSAYAWLLKQLKIPKSADCMLELATLYQASAKQRKSLLKADASHHSAWACWSLLKNNRLPGHDSLLIDHHRQQVALDLKAYGQTLIAEELNVELCVNGEPRVFHSPWRATCWFDDHEASYLEMRCSGDDQTHLDLQFLLSKQDHLLFLSSTALLPAPAEQIELTLTLDWPAGEPSREHKQTREWQGTRNERKWRLCPLGLPFAKVEPASGELKIISKDSSFDQIVLHQTGKGSALAVPLLFDWSVERDKQPSDWSILTISHDGKRCGADEAFASRVRIGSHQWLWFRNLTRQGDALAVLGHHTHQETVIGEVPQSGIIKLLVGVDLDEDSEEIESEET